MPVPSSCLRTHVGWFQIRICYRENLTNPCQHTGTFGFIQRQFKSPLVWPPVEKGPWLPHSCLKTLYHVSLASPMQYISPHFASYIRSRNWSIYLTDYGWLKANDGCTNQFARLCLRVLWTTYFQSFFSSCFVHSFSVVKCDHFPLSYAIISFNALPVARVDPCRVSIYPVVLGSEGNFHHFLSSHGHSKAHSLPGLADSFWRL